MLQLAEEAKKKTKKVTQKSAAMAIDGTTCILAEAPGLCRLACLQTDIEIENQARDETIRALAQEKLNMELDLVKHLRALAAQAEAFTVRDRQLKEKDGVIIKEKVSSCRVSARGY
jgi:hypothetical protein